MSLVIGSVTTQQSVITYWNFIIRLMEPNCLEDHDGEHIEIMSTEESYY